MDNVFVYIVDLPPNVDEMVVPCCEGYTVYIDVKLSHAEKVEAYYHALEHIKYDDFNCGLCVSDIETERHNRE